MGGNKRGAKVTGPSGAAARDAVILDDMSLEQIERFERETMADLDAIYARYEGLRLMNEDQRSASSGKSFNTVSGPLRLLFSTILTSATKGTPLARYFDAIGGKDLGRDPDRFEPELLLRRMDRVASQQRIRDRLDAMSRAFGDDILWTGAAVVGPGKAAIELATSLSNLNPDLENLLKPAMSAFRDMTKRARKALKDGLAAHSDQATDAGDAAKEEEDDDEGDPTKK